MATVHLAEDARLAGVHRLVVIKRIHEHLRRDPHLVEMFSDEGSVGSSIAHPNVCRVTDFGSHDGVPFIAMEYLCGQSLLEVQTRLVRARRAERIEPKRFVSIALRLLANACEGLHALHELRDDAGHLRGAVHRDVAPDNLFVTCSGVLKVVDFGIVSADGRRHRTETGVWKGKLAYLAPEVLSGSAATRAADIWSLGVVSWELFAGRRLFRRSSDAESMAAIAGERIEPPSRGLRDVPKGIDAVVLRALERHSSARPTSAREFGRALLESVSQVTPAAEAHAVEAFMAEEFGHDASCLLRLLGSERVEATLVPVDFAPDGTDSEPWAARAAADALTIEVRRGESVVWRAPFDAVDGAIARSRRGGSGR